MSFTDIFNSYQDIIDTNGLVPRFVKVFSEFQFFKNSEKGTMKESLGDYYGQDPWKPRHAIQQNKEYRRKLMDYTMLQSILNGFRGAWRIDFVSKAYISLKEYKKIWEYFVQDFCENGLF